MYLEITWHRSGLGRTSFSPSGFLWTALVKAYVASTNGMLTLHFLPGYAPELNPDELVWSHMKRTGVARAPLRKGEKLQEKIEAQLATLSKHAA